MTKRRILFLMLSLLAAALLAGCAANTVEDTMPAERYEAIVLKVSVEEVRDGDALFVNQYLTVQALEGPYKDKTFDTVVSVDIANSKNYFTYHTGDHVKIEVFRDEDGALESVSVYTLIRMPYIAVLAFVLLAIIGFIGRKKGLKTIVALVLTMVGVFGLMVPMITHGWDPVLSAVIVCVAVTFATMFIVGGFNRKSLAASIGTAGGLVCTFVVTMVMNALIRVSPVELESVDMLMTRGIGFPIDFNGIVIAAILVGSVGAMMDVGMDIASSINEIHTVNPGRSRRQLFRNGMNVGRDIMGTMANTLILAYTGCSLMLMVNWAVFSESFIDMLNNGYIAVEVVKALCGSYGMILTIPLSAAVASALIAKQKPSGNETAEDIQNAGDTEGSAAEEAGTQAAAIAEDAKIPAAAEEKPADL